MDEALHHPLAFAEPDCYPESLSQAASRLAFETAGLAHPR